MQETRVLVETKGTTGEETTSYWFDLPMEFVIFDGGRHGYDNLFCDEHDPAELKDRLLKRYEIPASKLVLELGYSVDYEDEKEDFEPDEADTVELINGERMPWEQVKRDGIDYIALYYVNEKGKPVQILDAELA